MKEQNIPKYYETDCSTEAGRTKVSTELSISLRVPLEEECRIHDKPHVRNLCGKHKDPADSHCHGTILLNAAT